MANEMDLLARALLASKDGGKIISNLEKFQKILDTAEGKSLLANLAGNGGDALKKAAVDAMYKYFADLNEENKIIELFVLKDGVTFKRNYEVISVFKILATDEEFKYYEYHDMTEVAEYEDYINKVKEKSLYKIVKQLFKSWFCAFLILLFGFLPFRLLLYP